MAGKYQVNKVKHLVCIFEQNNVKSKKEKRSSELTVVSRSSAEAVLCDHCLFGKTEQEADGFCKTCLEYLCKRCVQEHVKAKLTREHSLIRNNIPKEDAEVLRRMKTMVFCIEHPGQTIAYHCQEHDEYTCYLCKENNHKECKATSLIRSGQSNSDGTSSIFERLYTTRDKVRSLKDVKETRIKSLLQEKHQIQREQHGYFQELSESIAECVKRENSKCEELVGTMVKDSTNKVNECEKIEENDICQKEMLEAAIQYCSDDNLALITRMIERKMDTLEGKINCLEQEGSAQIRFCKNDSLLDNLSVGTVTVLHNKSDTSSREQVELASDEVEIASLEEDIRNDEVEIIQTVDRTYVPHTGVASYVSQRRTDIDCNIRLGDDYHTCSVWGLVVFPDGRLVLIDNANLKMKLFTKKFNFVCAEPVQDHPTSICYLGRDIVAVAFGKSTHIYTYFIGAQSIYPYRTLKTDGFFCRGLAFYRDNAVAAIVSNRDILRTVQADDDVKVHVFYLRTSCTQIIRYFESVEGNDLWFRDPKVCR
ncbi:uncharacterized protein LOC128548897 [Mercenaria mercenaria]|uniref:uncharacterized protein LOC128548897 n=1 Tax=Mercenaria mercenaria TaxID=6596 RepID=UPI00234E927C|nr:uncharacterized protein LOC128548897 [Mercenaria mercenaria]